MNSSIVIVIVLAGVAAAFSLIMMFAFSLATPFFSKFESDYQGRQGQEAVGNESLPIITQPIAFNTSALQDYRFVKWFDTVPLKPLTGDNNSSSTLGPAIAGIALDNNGHVFISDSSNNRIMKFDRDGKFITSWGRFGFSIFPYGFNIAMDLATDSDGNVYVLDMQGYKVKVYDNNGKFLKYFGHMRPNDCSDDNGDTHDLACDSGFRQSIGIDILEDKNNSTVMTPNHQNSSRFILVADDKIKKFTENGTIVAAWGENGTDRHLDVPEDVAADSSGNIYSIEPNLRRIQKFDSNGTFLGQWYLKGGRLDSSLSSIVGLDVDDKNGIIYAAATTSVQKFNTNGKFLGEWDKNNATKVAVSQDGSEIYTVDYYPAKYRIHVYDKDGHLLRQWGQSSNNFASSYVIPMLPAMPGDIWVDEKNNTEHSIYVQHDKNNGNFNGTLKFDQNGNFVSVVGAKEVQEIFGSKNAPRDSKGNTYTIGDDGSTIHKVSKDGRFLLQWGEECTLYSYNAGSWQFPRPVKAGKGCEDQDGRGPLQPGDGQFLQIDAVAIDSKDHIYVLDGRNDRIEKFDSDGKFISKIGIVNGSGAAHFMAIDKLDNIYVAKSGTSSPLIQKYDSYNFTLLAAWGTYCDIYSEERTCIDPDGEEGPLLPGYGQLFQITGLYVASDGKDVYVTDTIQGTQNSVVVFRRAP